MRKEAFLAGNPKALIALNNGGTLQTTIKLENGVNPISGGAAWDWSGETTQWEDMTAGETASFNNFAEIPPTSRCGNPSFCAICIFK